MSDVLDIAFKALAIDEHLITTKGNSPDLAPDLFDARVAIEKTFVDLCERLDNVDEIKDDKKALEILYDDLQNASIFYDATQLSAKTLANSMYGYVGAPFSRYYKKCVAADITAEGRNATKMADVRTTQYFESPKGWASETEYFEKIKVEFADIINVDKLTPVKASNGLGIYGDTDSVFFIMKPILDSLGVKPDADSYRCTELCVSIIMNPVDKIHKELFRRYAENRNCKNLQVFELEAILRRTIHLAKKKYIGSYFWKDGKFLIPKDFDSIPNAYKSIKLKSTGLELAQKSTPVIIKEYLKKYVYLMLSSKQVSDEFYFKMAYAMTKSFSDMHIDDYSKARALGTFNKYHDIKPNGQYIKTGGDKVMGACVRYNNEVINHGLESKYPMIAQGSRVKFYEDINQQTFAYPIDDNCSFPEEFAPPPHIRLNLEKMLFKPLERIMCKVTNADLSMLGSQHYQVTKSIFKKKKL
ncbi:DNA polymerase [Tenacibaculum phage pT24]|uniref:DNA-directed DNA polymerase n=1 Tax=Tenacibaculum phage pT24 TaxID=1880590 RepID=A0A1B4XWX1_9CAUD|nr:DNA polymerase [Tenacibaculum phage pT24]BAV39294.1 DNA polymerase [Tenacibaculum phage pT24]